MSNILGNETRYKLVLITLALSAVEGILKGFIPALPIVEMYSIQSFAVGTFLGVKTANNIKDSRYGQNQTVYLQAQKSPNGSCCNSAAPRNGD